MTTNPHPSPAAPVEPLLPCPFCGSAVRVRGLSGRHWIACRICDFNAPSRDNHESAVRHWNRRAPAPAAHGEAPRAEEVEALAVALDMEADSVERNYADGPVSPGWLRDIAARLRATARPSAREMAEAVIATLRAEIITATPVDRLTGGCCYQTHKEGMRDGLRVAIDQIESALTATPGGGAKGE